MEDFMYMDYRYPSFILFLGIIAIIIITIYLIVNIIATWKVFKKAGRNGWESIVPIYSYWVLTEIAGLNWWWFLLLIIDVAFKFEIEGLTLAINLCGFFASFNCYYNIARKFGKNKKTSIFAGMFPFIFILIFGFSKKEVYNVNIPVSSNGIFGTSDINIDTTDDYHNEEEQKSAEIIEKEKNTTGKKKQEYSFCGDCGTKLNKDVNFCPNCGKEKNN